MVLSQPSLNGLVHSSKFTSICLLLDDELPDYIMVMVANKKSQASMTEDLSLFLGNNTDNFTAW